jgi:hypothetical protein
LGLNGIQPYVSINVNVPTGATVLRGSQAVTRPDSDIFGFAGFGEGWNIGPTIGVNIPISQNLIVAAGVGLTSRGAFDREGLNIGSAPSLGPIQHFNPGDVWTINSSAGYQEGAWSLQAAGSYSWETTTTVDGAAFYRTGQRYQLVGAVGYAWDSNWSSKLSSSFLHTRRNEVQLPLFAGGVLGLLMWEAFNTNSNVTTASFETTYRQGNFAIGPTVGFLYRDHNGYDSTRQEFLPAKTKWSVGGTGQYAVTDKVSFNARVEYIWATVNAEPQEINSQGVPISDTAIPPIYTRAWLVSLAGTAKF